jgi:5'-nucleotidase
MSWKRQFLLLVLSLFMTVVVCLPQTGSNRLTILLSNDDGYDAPGLRALIEALRPASDVIVAAPAVEQSGKGHSLILRDPIFVTEKKQADGTMWYAIDASPASCVRLAVENLLTRRPALVISGINRGENLGATVYHSGTLGAAREAAIVGLPAIAVSIGGDEGKDYAAAANFIRRLVDQLQAKQMLKPGLFLNVNVPAGERKGVRVTRLSVKPRYDTFERRVSPSGRLYFWPAWKQLEDDEEGTDIWAFARGFIAITPMGLDVTAVQAIEGLRAIISETGHSTSKLGLNKPAVARAP